MKLEAKHENLTQAIELIIITKITYFELCKSKSEHKFKISKGLVKMNFQRPFNPYEVRSNDLYYHSVD